MLSATARRSIHQEGCVVRGRRAGKTSTTLAVLLHPTICSTCSRSGLGRSDQLIRRHPNGRNRVRRETGKEQMVRVHYDEGVAIHIGPESCAGGREAVREALTGECAGQPLSREKVDIPGADAVRYAEGHTKGRAIASSPTTRRGRRPWHVQTLFVREPGGLVADQGGMPRLVRIGKARSRSR
jgi:hypothetical protein